MEFEQGTNVPAANADRIQWFQDAYRVSLPREYIATLQKGNGAVPRQPTFAHLGRDHRIQRMLCLLDRPKDDPIHGWHDLSVVLTQLDACLIDDEDLIGMNVIPFAVLSNGDFLCLDYRHNPATPVVALWDHERSEEFQPVLTAVAPSFAAFESMLR